MKAAEQVQADIDTREKQLSELKLEIEKLKKHPERRSPNVLAGMKQELDKIVEVKKSLKDM